MIQVETVSHRSDPSEYMGEDDYWIDQYPHPWREDDVREGFIVNRESLADAIMCIDHDTIIVGKEPNDHKHPDASFVLRICDGYNE